MVLAIAYLLMFALFLELAVRAPTIGDDEEM